MQTVSSDELMSEVDAWISKVKQIITKEKAFDVTFTDREEGRWISVRPYAADGTAAACCLVIGRFNEEDDVEKLTNASVERNKEG